MKEKETTATCRCCGQPLPIKTGPFFFHEEWSMALSIFGAKTTGHTAFINIDGEARIRSSYHGSEAAPQCIIDWVDANPDPKINRDKFIHQLGERVAALEAALAEKGGQR